MSGTHDSGHEERLFAVCGEFAQDPEAQRRAFEATGLATCAECRTLFTELAETEQFVAAAAGSQRELERNARAAPPAPGEERVRRALIERAERESRGKQHVEAPRSRRLWLAVAAILVAALLAQTAWLASRPKRSTPLGDDLHVELVAPLGTVARFAPFVWNAELPPQGGYRVRVHGERADGTPFERESGWLTLPRWDPGDAELASWPAQVRWEVEVVDASTNPRGRASASATRSGP